MNVFVVALKVEAQPLVQELGLKPLPSRSTLAVFGNEENMLVQTGIGPVAAAIGVTHILSVMDSLHINRIFNVGIAGCPGHIPIGTICMISKVTYDQYAYYPDMLVKHPFHEASLKTYNHVVTSEHTVETDLVDMEAAAIMKAASKFIASQRVSIIKIVSDHLDSHMINKDDVSKLMMESLPSIISWIDDTHPLYASKQQQMNSEDTLLFEEICSILHLTNSMRHELQQYMIHCRNNHQEPADYLADFRQYEIKTKQQGKKAFESIKQRFMGSPFFPHLY